MYFDAVIEIESGNVLFNGTPDETEEFLRHRSEHADKDVYVMDGAGLRSYTVEEYLAR